MELFYIDSGLALHPFWAKNLPGAKRKATTWYKKLGNYSHYGHEAIQLYDATKKEIAYRPTDGTNWTKWINI